MKRILVHSCCAPCSTYPYEKLSIEGFSVSGYFYNPNIYPIAEYTRRLEEYSAYMNLKGYSYHIEEADFENWNEKNLSLKDEKEGGARCAVCFELRLEAAASYAKNNGFDFFTTVLTVSPHKNTKVINEIGLKLAEQYNIKFLEENFKKQDGFKKSLELSKQNSLYRQSYCGCKYSIREN